MSLPASDEIRRARLSAFLAHAPETIFIKDSEGRYVEASDAFLALGGWTSEQLIGKSDFEVFPEHMAAKFTAEDAQVRSTGEPMLFEENYEHGGQAVAFLTQKFPLPNGEVAGIATDITERKRSAAELESVADRLRVAIEGTGIGTYEFNLSTREGAWSEATFRILGLEPTPDLRGGSDAWLEAIHPDDREAIRTDYNSAAERGGSWKGEYRINRADTGETRWLFAYGRFLSRGADSYSTGIVFDVTDRKSAEIALRESEARLRALTDNLPGGMVYQVCTGPDGTGRKFLFASQSFEKISGYKAEEVLANPMVAYGMILPEHRERLAAAEEQAIRTMSMFDCEAQFRHRDGHVGWCRIISAPRKQEDGTFIWDGIQVDITAQKRAEQELRDLNATLEQRVAERAAELAKAEEALRQAQKLESMGQLTGGVAHDFNNLLSPIIGGLDMLQRRGVGDERARRTIEGALSAAERAKILVQRLLAFARRQPLQPRPVDAVDLVRGIASLLDSTVGPRITLDLHLGDKVPCAIADPNQLELALLNLTLNARDAMPEGGTLTLSVLASGDRASVCLRVADTGFGMDEPTLARAVEPFFSTKGIGQGTGLGLSMVHGLALQLGGKLSISSTPGQGTTIDLLLPATERSGNAQDAPAHTPAQTGSGTAILVDDEELVRASVSDMLTDLGFTVSEASTAAHALQLIEQGETPNILITDHLMPGMTGSELIAAVRARLPDLPVLLISGYAEADGIPAGVPRLSKPFRAADLEAALAGISERGTSA